MATSEQIVSPGVFTNEVDQSFLPAAVGEIGAAVIGPTVKGPAMIPTVVSSMSEFSQVFGEALLSGSSKTTYLTSELARNYLKNGNKLTVVRILDGEFTPATANVMTGSGLQFTGSDVPHQVQGSEISFKLHTHDSGEILNNYRSVAATAVDAIDTTGVETAAADCSFTINIPAANGGEGGAITILLDESENSDPAEGANTIAIAQAGTSDADKAADIIDAINGTTNALVDFASSGRGQAGVPGVTATQGSSDTQITLTMDTVLGTDGNITNAITTAAGVDIVDNRSFTGGVDSVGTNMILTSGSSDNIRYEVTNANHTKGTFNLLIRSGNDTHKEKQILETFNNLSIDPKENNYIARVIGDMKPVLSNPGTTDVHVAMSGSYVNKSKYVRVEVVKPVTEYLDTNGNVSNGGAVSSSMPGNGSGSFGGSFSGGSSGFIGYDAFGNLIGGSGNPGFHENISNTNTQGYILQTANQGKTAYEDAINLLSNQDEYDINLLFMPGVIDNFANHQAIVTKAIDMVKERGDVFLVVDPTGFGDGPTAATTRAEAHNSSYAAMYYPWVRVASPVLGKHIWACPSVAVAGVYSFNDKVAHPWFAPAGLNRGGLESAQHVERQLLRGQRDELYESNVNPIATFPAQGVCVFGQKTLQKKASALDRVNVRRLLITLKKFFASTSRFLVFEQNNSKTRSRFLNIVNPYMEQVQSNSGVNVFKVVMDESNNTPDTIDRNQLVGQVIIQPTRTAEFIVLDFTVQRTGAAFPE